MYGEPQPSIYPDLIGIYHLTGIFVLNWRLCSCHSWVRRDLSVVFQNSCDYLIDFQLCENILKLQQYPLNDLCNEVIERWRTSRAEVLQEKELEKGTNEKQPGNHFGKQVE